MLFLLFKGSLFDFVGVNDGYFRQNFGQEFVDAIIEDRKSIFTEDTIRTLVLVLLSAGTLFMFLMKKLSKTLVLVVFTVLIVFDLVGVDRRYVNNDNFISSIKVNKPYESNSADLEILKDTTYFRVFDISSEGSRAPAKAAYYHNSLNGYHAAKLKRFNELYSFYISQNNLNVLSMLNTKYIIAEDDKGNVFPYVNEDANGNAWFVSELEKVENANEEIKALDSLDSKQKAVTTSQLLESKSFVVDSTAFIKLIDYKPNYLKYRSYNSNDGFAVFSEMYYENGWVSLIDGKQVPHYRVDYTLRGIEIPKGEHTIEFKFDPQVIKTGSHIALASSIVLVLLILGGVYYEFKKK